MEKKVLSELTDQALLAEEKKMKSNAIISALLIGFMIGIILFSIWKNTIGLLTLIPLYFIFRMFKKPDNKEELEQILKERNLK